jgi:hypothetical protein
MEQSYGNTGAGDDAIAGINAVAGCEAAQPV